MVVPCIPSHFVTAQSMMLKKLYCGQLGKCANVVIVSTDAPIISHTLFSVFTLLTVLYRSYREERVHIRSSSSATERLGTQTKMRRKMIVFTIFFVLQWAPVVSFSLKVTFGQPISVSLVIFARFIEHSIGIFDAVLWF